jgi:hypothetical protein
MRPIIIIMLFVIVFGGCNNGPGSAPQQASKPVEPSKCEIASMTNADSPWQYSEKKSEMDGRKTTIAGLRNVGTGQEIIVRCSGSDLRSDALCSRGKLEAYVALDDMVDSSGSVRIRFDDGAPTRQSWSRSDDYKALFAPNARAFVAQLLKSKEFLFEYPPYEKVPETIHFHVSGLKESGDADSMEQFVRSLTHDELVTTCGTGSEETSATRTNVNYLPSSPSNIGLQFEFSTYGNDAGHLISIAPIGGEKSEKYKLTWYGTIGGPDAATAHRIVTSSPGLLARWQATQHPHEGNKPNARPAGN